MIIVRENLGIIGGDFTDFRIFVGCLWEGYHDRGTVEFFWGELFG